MKYTKNIEALEAGDLVKLGSLYSDPCWYMLVQIKADSYRLVCMDGGNRLADEEVCGASRRISIKGLRDYFKECRGTYDIMEVAEGNQLQALLDEHLNSDPIEVPK